MDEVMPAFGTNDITNLVALGQTSTWLETKH